MKATDLERIISGINRKYLDELCGPLPNGSESDRKEASRRSSPSGKTVCGDEGCFGGISSSPCFCGITLGGYHNGAELEKLIILHDSAPDAKGVKVAVGAVIDDATTPNGADEGWPVVLAVGINYGQMGSHNYLDPLLFPNPPWDPTEMRTKLDKVFATLRDETETKCVPPNFPDPLEYHLVATNFFPWITQKSWSKCGFNFIEEMLLIYCHGFSDPFAHIEKICQRLLVETLKGEKKLKALVFHGAKNAVPCLGAEFLRTRMAEIWKKIAPEDRPEIVFCDNLAPSRNPNITNAVRICNGYQKRSGMPDTFDE